MNIYKYILKSLWYFRKQHLAVLAATIVSTAVLTGALIIGDSVKYSLNHLVDLRLGSTRYAMHTGDRFVQQNLAVKISDSLEVKAAAGLMLKGIAVNNENQKRINRIQVLGVDNSFWKLSHVEIIEIKDDEAIISEIVAQKLKLVVDDEFLLKVENADIIPINAPFVAESNPTISLRLKVKKIVSDDQLARFSLQSDQKAPNNIFLSYKFLSNNLQLNELANFIIVSDNENNTMNEDLLNETFNSLWSIRDIGIDFYEINETEQIEIKSNRIFIDAPISDAIQNLQYPKEEILTYLVNAVKYNDRETPYSFVSAISSAKITKDLIGNEIVINSWLAEDLKVKIDDTVTLDYYIIGPLRTLEVESANFIIKKIIPTDYSESKKALMPDFPGLADAGSCRDWNTGITIDLTKIRNKDELYWNNYKGTPKAYISLFAGHKLWNNRFGQYTAFRFNKNDVNKQKLQRLLSIHN